MTQKDKELLLVDLCGRLPYGVRVRYSSTEIFITATLRAIDTWGSTVDLRCIPSKDNLNACFDSVFVDKIKPYLFPLSSMTEEQKDEFDRLYTYDALIVEPQWKLIDFCNKHNLDYRGLIPKGLAIDASGLNIY